MSTFGDAVIEFDLAVSGVDTIINFDLNVDGIDIDVSPGVDIRPMPDITIGTVETLEPGEDAYATMTGTSTHPILNLGIPKGENGDAGHEPNDGILTIEKNGQVIGTFSANSAEDVTVNIEADQQVNADWEAESGPAQILNKPTDLEYTSNRVTAIDQNSTDDQYPTAKAVWDVTLRVVRNASGSMVFLKG